MEPGRIHDFLNPCLPSQGGWLPTRGNLLTPDLCPLTASALAAALIPPWGPELLGLSLSSLPALLLQHHGAACLLALVEGCLSLH